MQKSYIAFHRSLPFSKHDQNVITVADGGAGPAPGLPFTPRSPRDINEHGVLSERPPDESRSMQSVGDRWMSDISVDRHGEVAYHNSTSAIHEAPSDNHPPGSLLHSSDQTSNLVLDAPNSATLLANLASEKESHSVVEKNIEAVQSEVSGYEGKEFLKYYWCWIHPMFMFVDRPSFTSTYFSHG